MTFSDLYRTNNDWGRPTLLKINVGAVNNYKKLTAFKALSMYSDYEVVGFDSNCVTLIPPVCRTVQASKQAIHRMDEQIMLIVFKEYLKDITFDKSETYRIVGSERTYSFKTVLTNYGWESTYNIDTKDINNCNDLQVLIALAECINKSQS